MVAALIYILTNSVRGFPFLHILSRILICRLLNDSHSDRCDWYLLVAVYSQFLMERNANDGFSLA